MEIQPAPAPAVDPRPGAELDVVVVGGGGHVGLPLSLVLADAGLRVGIFDIAEDTLATIASGRVPFLESGADALLERVLASGRLELSTEPGMIGRAQTVLVVIGTPIDEFLNPSMAIFGRAVRQMAPHLRDGALVILRSTVYPGTTAYVSAGAPGAGLPRGRRVLPGADRGGPRASDELRSLPQIVGADEPLAGDRAEALFRRLTAHVIRTSSREAELAKLFTNTWRYMKFAIANQFLMVAHEAGIDYTNVLDAVRRDYPRAADLPGPGFAAGPCLFKDTMQLARLHQRSLPHGPGGDAGERGAAGVHGSCARASPGVAAGAHHRHPGDGLQGGVRRHRAVLSATSCASC